MKRPQCLLLTTQCQGRLTGQAADGGAVFILDASNIPRVSILESNPIHNLSQLEDRSRNLAITVIDDAHRHVFDAFAIAPRAIGFLPHAGPPPLARILPTCFSSAMSKTCCRPMNG
jgi:hypothetical protein